jgi:hypothetical protein
MCRPCGTCGAIATSAALFMRASLVIADPNSASSHRRGMADELL